MTEEEGTACRGGGGLWKRRRRRKGLSPVLSCLFRHPLGWLVAWDAGQKEEKEKAPFFVNGGERERGGLSVAIPKFLGTCPRVRTRRHTTASWAWRSWEDLMLS